MLSARVHVALLCAAVCGCSQPHSDPCRADPATGTLPCTADGAVDAPMGLPDARLWDAAPIDAAPPDAPYCAPTESVCNCCVSDFPIECCTPAQHCCPFSFEWECCAPIDQPCGHFCHAFFTVCPADEVCLVNYDLGPFPAPYTCDSPDGHFTVCSPTPCPPERMCGEDCCGTNAVCQDGCCAYAPPDAGMP